MNDYANSDETDAKGSADQNTDGHIPIHVVSALIDYYKWIAGGATFVLTTSLTFGPARADGDVPFVLLLGWTFLGACLFFNFHVIKSLVVVHVFRSPYLESAATVQHLCFLTGVLFTCLGLIMHLGYSKILLATAITAFACWQVATYAHFLSAIMLRLSIWNKMRKASQRGDSRKK